MAYLLIVSLPLVIVYLPLSALGGGLAALLAAPIFWRRRNRFDIATCAAVMTVACWSYLLMTQVQGHLFEAGLLAAGLDFANLTTSSGQARQIAESTHWQGIAWAAANFLISALFIVALRFARPSAAAKVWPMALLVLLLAYLSSFTLATARTHLW